MKIGYFLAGVGCIGFGALMLAVGAKTIKACSGKTVGTITGVHESEGRDRDNYITTNYSPEFEYKVDGRIYHGTGDTSYESIKKIKIGGSIKVHYNPDNPEEHYTKGGGLSMPIFGAAVLVFGVLLVFTAL